MIHEFQEMKYKEMELEPLFYKILQYKPLTIIFFPFYTAYPYVGEIIIVRTIDKITNVESKMMARVTS